MVEGWFGQAVMGWVLFGLLAGFGMAGLGLVCFWVWLGFMMFTLSTSARLNTFSGTKLPEYGVETKHEEELAKV
jgi:hypothetical protein